jgi:hypothetical protein
MPKYIFNRTFTRISRDEWYKAQNCSTETSESHTRGTQAQYELTGQRHDIAFVSVLVHTCSFLFEKGFRMNHFTFGWQDKAQGMRFIIEVPMNETANFRKRRTICIKEI